MQRTALSGLGILGLLALTLALGSCGNGGGGSNNGCTPGPLPPSVGPMPGANMTAAMDVFNMTNTYRMMNGRPPLTWSATAAQAAYDHAADQETRNYFSHTSLGCQDVGARLTAAGVVFSAWAENIAQGQANAAAVMMSWQTSPGHNANLLSTTVTHLGVGVADLGGSPTWVQKFFAP